MKCILILLILLTGSAQAIEVDLGIGYTWTEKPPNTLWYQEEFDHSIDSESTNYQIGLRFSPYQNIYLTTGYKHLGKLSVSSDFIANDYTYYEWQKGGKAPPLSHLTGSGKAHGIYFKAEYHFKHVFFTGGGWAHETEWRVKSPHEWKMYRRGPNKGEIHGPYNIQHEGDTKISVSWIVGIGIKYNRVSILAEIWDTEENKGVYSTFSGNSKVITLLYTLQL